MQHAVVLSFVFSVLSRTPYHLRPMENTDVRYKRINISNKKKKKKKKKKYISVPESSRVTMFRAVEYLWEFLYRITKRDIVQYIH